MESICQTRFILHSAVSFPLMQHGKPIRTLSLFLQQIFKWTPFFMFIISGRPLFGFIFSSIPLLTSTISSLIKYTILLPQSRIALISSVFHSDSFLPKPDNFLNGYCSEYYKINLLQIKTQSLFILFILKKTYIWVLHSKQTLHTFLLPFTLLVPVFSRWLQVKFLGSIIKNEALGNVILAGHIKGKSDRRSYLINLKDRRRSWPSTS